MVRFIPPLQSLAHRRILPFRLNSFLTTAATTLLWYSAIHEGLNDCHTPFQLLLVLRTIPSPASTDRNVNEKRAKLNWSSIKLKLPMNYISAVVVGADRKKERKKSIHQFVSLFACIFSSGVNLVDFYSKFPFVLSINCRSISGGDRITIISSKRMRRYS